MNIYLSIKYANVYKFSINLHQIGVFHIHAMSCHLDTGHFGLFMKQSDLNVEPCLLQEKSSKIPLMDISCSGRWTLWSCQCCWILWHHSHCSVHSMGFVYIHSSELCNVTFLWWFDSQRKKVRWFALILVSLVFVQRIGIENSKIILMLLVTWCFCLIFRVFMLQMSAYCFGLITLSCLAFLFLPITRGSILLRLIGIPFEHTTRYHVWLGNLVMFLSTMHGLCYMIVWTIRGIVASEVSYFCLVYACFDVSITRW